MKPNDEKALKLCAAINYWDDRLGKYSDYEGDENGPTWHLWNRGREDFDIHCCAAIEAHKQAIKVLRRFIRLNQKREVSQ